MNALEELLSDAMSETADGAPSVEADWERVTTTVGTRQRRRANTYRLGVVVLIAVLGFGLFSSRFGVPVDTGANPTDTNNPIVEAPELGIWPSAQDVATAAGERPQSQFWIAWLIGAGLPLLAAVNAWVRAPQHLRVPVAGQRFARMVLASSAALAATVAVGLAVCAFLFFTYDPLAAQTGSSYLLSVLGIVDLSLISSVVMLGFSLSASRDPGDGVGARVFVGSLGALVALYVLGVARGILLLEFDWKTSGGVEGPTRGLWRLFSPSDAAYSGPSGGVISVAGAVSGATVGLVGVVVALWFARTATMSALAGDRLRSLAADVGSTAADARSRALRMTTWLLVTLAAALPAYVYVQKDVVAQSVAHIATLPADVVDLSDGFGPRVVRDFDRGAFEQLDLVEITFWPSSTSSFDEITDEQLLPERFGFEQRRIGVFVRGDDVSNEAPTSAFAPSADSGIAIWTVDRDQDSSRITVSVRREAASLGMNTALFISALLILLATSTSFFRFWTGEAPDPDAISGRRGAGQFAIATSVAIGGHLVAAVISLENLVEDSGRDNLLNLINSRRPFPKSIDDISPWFVLNAFTLVPVIGLATLGLRRLTRSRLIMGLMVAAMVLSAVMVGVLWGELLLDRFLD